MIAEPANQDVRLAPPPRRRLLGLGLALAALALLIWLAARAATPGVDREQLRLATVSRGPFVADLSVTGRVVAAVSPTLYAPAAGTVTLAVQAGQQVAAGAVLARLDSPELASEHSRETAQLASLQASLGRARIEARTTEAARRQALDLAQVELEAAERELRRAEEAHRMGVYARREVDRAADALANARVRRAHAEREVSLAVDASRFELQTRELDVQRQQVLVEELGRRVAALEIRSPVAGLVGALAVVQKARVAADAPLLTVVDLSALEVEIQIPETLVDTLALNLPAEIDLGGTARPARLTAISPEVANNQVTGRVAFDGAPPAELRQNQRLSVRLILQRRASALQLPRGSFVESGGGREVWKLVDGVLTRVPVRLGAIAVDRVEILEGLSEGEVVVIAGEQDFGEAERLVLRD
ncbi:MAG TPA: HlyD family efflux transporter periplasmic adaptor subunit [Nevskiaceae bacterium]|nr:HlyD family efflux transporter periplasmic adaptor subunit [Nevskiaceae bacterium]